MPYFDSCAQQLRVAYLTCRHDQLGRHSCWQDQRGSPALHSTAKERPKWSVQLPAPALPPVFNLSERGARNRKSTSSHLIAQLEQVCSNWGAQGSNSPCILHSSNVAFQRHALPPVTAHVPYSAPCATPNHGSGLWHQQSSCAPRTKTPSEFGRCSHFCALQSLGHCAVNFGPILLKLKYVTALAPVVDVIASPAAAELDAPCCQKQPTAS